MFLYDKFPDFVIDLEFHNATYMNRGRDTKIFVNYTILNSEQNMNLISSLPENKIFKGRELKLVDMYFGEEKQIRFTNIRTMTYNTVLKYICEFQKEIRSLLKNQQMVYHNHKVKPTVCIQMNEVIILNWEFTNN
ncbi:hypothetical protein Yalta_044 [Yalta virus]|nr:hypothetical protein Yalta_044 [Yalta virus]